jgi:hypothetical protein
MLLKVFELNCDEHIWKNMVQLFNYVQFLSMASQADSCIAAHWSASAHCRA